jgi:hypothetical protein
MQDQIAAQTAHIDEMKAQCEAYLTEIKKVDSYCRHQHMILFLLCADIFR